MNSKLDEMLQNVAEEVFESLAFLIVMPEEEQAGSVLTDDNCWTAATVAFAGPFSGALFLSVSADMLPAIAANMLGLDGDEALSPVQQRDAFKELVNVVCGNLLPALAGDKATFDVRAPEVLPEGRIPPSLQGRPPAATARLNLDAGRAELALFAAAVPLKTDPPV